MPYYRYECNQCKHQFDIIKSIRCEKPEPCPECDGDTRRLIQRTLSLYEGDWNKEEFNRGLGKVVKNPKHRKELANRAGMEEIGNDSTPSDYYSTSEKDREAALKARWDKV